MPCSVDEFAVKLSESMTVDDLRKPEAWFKSKNARALTAADKSRTKHRAPSAPVVQRASHVYSTRRSRQPVAGKSDSSTLSKGRSAGSLPPSVDLEDSPPPHFLPQGSVLDGDSAVLNARSGIVPPQQRTQLLQQQSLTSTFNQSLASMAGESPSRSSAYGEQPAQGGSVNQGGVNFATSSLAFSGHGGMQLAGMSGMFSAATMPDLTRHDPRELGQAVRTQTGSSSPEFLGAVTNANRQEVIKTFFKEDIPPPIKAQMNSSLPLGVAPRDPYMGAGSAAGYGVGHEVRLAQRSGTSYGSSLAQRKVAGEEIWMYAEDEAERSETGWDPAEIGKQRMSETYLQTGSGLKKFNFRGNKAAAQKQLAQAASAPVRKANHDDSVVAPALTVARSQRIGASGAATDASKTLRSMIGAQLGATPLALDPRAANFRPHASISRSKPNAERRKKLAKQGPIKGPLQKQEGVVSAYALPLKQGPRGGKAVPTMKEYDAGGSRGLGAGMGKGSVQVPYKLKDSATADGTLLTSERLQEMVQAFESGSEIQRLRRELEEARSSMQHSQNILQASARDWRHEQAKETQSLVGQDLMALSGQAGNVHSRFSGAASGR